MVQRLVIGILIGMVLGSLIGRVAADVIMSPQITTCTPTSPYACIFLPGTSSGGALILVKPNAGNPVLTLPTETGTFLTEEKARTLFVLTASPSPVPAPSVTPLPVPTLNPIILTPASLSVTEPFGLNDPNFIQVVVRAPGAWIASTPTVPWLATHCVTGGCGGSFFQVQIRSAPLARGVYNSQVTVTSGNASQRLNITVTVQ